MGYCFAGVVGKWSCCITPLGHAVVLYVSNGVPYLEYRMLWEGSAFVLLSVGLTRDGSATGFQPDTPGGQLAAAAVPHGHQLVCASMM